MRSLLGAEMFITIAALIIAFTINNDAVFGRDVGRLIFTTKHEMLDIDLRALEPFPGIDGEPENGCKLQNC